MNNELQSLCTTQYDTIIHWFHIYIAVLHKNDVRHCIPA